MPARLPSIRPRALVATAVAALVVGAGIFVATRSLGAAPGASPSVPAQAGATTAASADVSAPAPGSSRDVASAPAGCGPLDPCLDQQGTMPGPSVQVVMTTASWDPASAGVAVSGYASALDTGGMCTLRLTSSSGSVSVDAPAVPDASSMSCGLLTVPGSQLHAGSWKAVLAYESAQYSGSSSHMTIEIP